MFTRSIVVDGNFQAEHLKMRRPEKDVALTAGTGFMVEEQEYKEHLKDCMKSSTLQEIGNEVSLGC